MVSPDFKHLVLVKENVSVTIMDEAGDDSHWCVDVKTRCRKKCYSPYLFRPIRHGPMLSTLACYSALSYIFLSGTK